MGRELTEQEILMNQFDDCVDMKIQGSTHKIECKLGLWGVEGKDLNSVIREAKHYWMQYKTDGEYSSIIGGKSVIEVLTTNQERV